MRSFSPCAVPMPRYSFTRIPASIGYYRESEMSVETLNRRQAKQERTRSLLLQAAGSGFARRGYHVATLADVAAEAGFTKGAVYSNFESKEDLFLALVDI